MVPEDEDQRLMQQLIEKQEASAISRYTRRQSLEVSGVDIAAVMARARLMADEGEVEEDHVTDKKIEKERMSFSVKVS